MLLLGSVCMGNFIRLIGLMVVKPRRPGFKPPCTWRQPMARGVSIKADRNIIQGIEEAH